MVLTTRQSTSVFQFVKCAVGERYLIRPQQCNASILIVFMRTLNSNFKAALYFRTCCLKHGFSELLIIGNNLVTLDFALSGFR